MNNMLQAELKWKFTRDMHIFCNYLMRLKIYLETKVFLVLSMLQGLTK